MKKPFIAFFFTITIFIAQAYANLVSIYEEDFESYNDGQLITDQNGWYGSGQVVSSPSAYLGSSVLNGFDRPNGFNIDVSYVDLDYDDMNVVIFEADFYAGTGGGYHHHTHNAGISLKDSLGNSFGAIQLNQNSSSAQWLFIINNELGQTSQVNVLSQGYGVGTDTLVQAKIIWDQTAQLATGSVSFDGQTYSHAINYDFNINDAIHFEVYNDHRTSGGFKTGMEMDKLSLKGSVAVPEPSVLALMGFGLFLFGLKVNRRKCFNR